MSFQKLPAEVILGIIGELGDDKNTLMACSLVGWTLLPWCRYYMFSDLSVEYGEFGKFLDVVRMGSSCSNSTIGSAVRRLNVRIKDSGCCVGGDGIIGAVSEEVVRSLQGVQSVRLSVAGVGGGGLDSFSKCFWEFLRELKGVREVVIEGGTFGGYSLDQLVEWISSGVEVVEVVRSTWVLPVPFVLPESWRSDGAVKIGLVDIESPDQFGVVKWLIAQSFVPSVKKLRIGCEKLLREGSDEDLELLGTFIRIVGPGVESLQIVLPRNLQDLDGLMALDFSPCNNLQAIKIEGIRIGPPGRLNQGSTLEKLLGMLVTRCRPHLRRVVLTVGVEVQVQAVFAFFGIPDSVLFGSFDWGKIPEILDKGFDGEVIIIYEGNLKIRCGLVESVLRRGAFRVFDEKNMLRVVY